jgi:hypothetical protein
MDQPKSPFGIERRLTPELLDHYVAKARAERAGAIAGFFAQIARWLGRARARTVIGGPRRRWRGTTRSSA